MEPFIDVAMGVSEALSQILESAVNDPDAEESATLGSARRVIARMPDGKYAKADRMHFDPSRPLLEEIDDLIEQFGDEAPAIDFVTVKASEDMSRIIAAMMDTGASSPPTLEMVRDAMLNGLMARLAGEGEIDSDQDETLQNEVETLISHYGPDAAAENFLRYD
ncbi:MAG: hypothetical protein PHG47_11160 [Sulfuricella sp.]|nr:hypothetical protein [Sulfuricella sp.]